ncbi:KilA-N domain-containing protein [Lelliottia sp. V89_10]|uniref:KilA-N domain-containing protein n=1 Tax=Lelliottia wanjuensis TaxID=3050585 RepID=UPI00249EAD26|nr:MULTISPECIES: KilA-N domain-containing protein [unclassified Lelliottia]MDI3359782.1 KilA-N domain-containing protein [Lelliottia sp. V89_13]MDK9548740.1 KilA-N domain-containing protein [Lelliottia sp. V89_5]MDK9597372.1 KilA-N domain-containing protein [Lelliottia sp. V89_10]
MTIQIVISDIVIHQDSEGRFSINDLHRAAGAKERHKPAFWLRLDHTKEIIEELIKLQICNFQPTMVVRGCRGGTYVCRELVYSYAMWVSASFHVNVIRAYDALITAPIPKTTVDERTPLRDAVNLLVSKRALPYDQAYSMIHQRFAVPSIEDLSPETLPAAIEYVHRLALEGELLGRQPEPVMPIFPMKADFEYLTTVRGGRVTEIRLALPGEAFISFESYTEMTARAGFVTMPHKALRSMSAAEIISACDSAEKIQARWDRAVRLA